MEEITVKVHDREISLSTGRIARQADGSVVARCGDTFVLATAVARRDEEWVPRDFMPLTVDFIERHLAAGKIPGGFFKREGKPSEREVLVSRLIDRPLRPLFPKGYSSETQIIATVLSCDGVADSDMLAMTAASAALYISDIPFDTPIAGVRVGLLGGKWIVNPAMEDYDRLEANLAVASSREAIVMVEGGAVGISEDVITDGLFLAFEAAQKLIDAQEELRRKVGKEKRPVPDVPVPDGLEDIVREKLLPRLREALKERTKLPRRDAIHRAMSETASEVLSDERFSSNEAEFRVVAEGIFKEEMRRLILEDGVRVDGRAMDEVRPIDIEVGILPRTHGSALFTRGETQAIVTTTLGSREDEQKIDTAAEETYKKFMLHYNFPPYSVNEVKFLRGPGRREIGHGALAERAIKPVLPPHEEFPYTIRVVSDIVESNGSSSMATVCGASLSLMDAGVPVRDAVAGIAMGLIKDGERTVILTDILGDEDHIGDMDFKVAGTADGVTAIQMDIKCSGVTRELMSEALERARKARLHILEKMNAVIGKPREELSPYAPRITTIHINPDKIKDLIGPGGKHIRNIVESTGVKIDVENDGTVHIASLDPDMADKAMEMIDAYTAEPEVGKVYEGKVERIADFGAFVEIMPNVVGLLHISQIAHRRIDKVTDVIKPGDVIKVKVLDIEPGGKIRLSRKELIKKQDDDELDDSDGRGRSLRSRGRSRR